MNKTTYPTLSLTPDISLALRLAFESCFLNTIMAKSALDKATKTVNGELQTLDGYAMPPELKQIIEEQLKMLYLLSDSINDAYETHALDEGNSKDPAIIRAQKEAAEFFSKVKTKGTGTSL